MSVNVTVTQLSAFEAVPVNTKAQLLLEDINQVEVEMIEGVGSRTNAAFAEARSETALSRFA